MTTDREMHFNDKQPFDLSQVGWKDPKKPSRDLVSVTHDETWSQMRTEALGRPVSHFQVLNETKGNQYSTEFMVGVRGEPLGVCNCPSAVPCKHMLAALTEFLDMEPAFAVGLEQTWINKIANG